MIILGIDPGLANTGWGVVDSSGTSHTCIAYGCITTGANEPLPDRLRAIHDELAAVIARYLPDAGAVESVFFGSNAKSAFATGQARGVALLALADRGVDLGEYSPVQIKSTVVGSGSAEKGQIAYMTKVLLDLPHEPKPDHAADALAAAICHAHHAPLRMRAESAGALR